MARLFQGEKTRRKRGILRLLQRCRLGLTEAEIAQELGWERRTANNYLRELAAVRVAGQTRTVDGAAYSVGIEYDNLSRSVRTTYPSGEAVVVGYDKEGEDSLKAGSDTIAAVGGVGKAQKVLRWRQ